MSYEQPKSVTYVLDPDWRPSIAGGAWDPREALANLLGIVEDDECDISTPEGADRYAIFFAKDCLDAYQPAPSPVSVQTQEGNS